ncbi:GNAT family N-acetyltransferase [Actinocorallia sp. A-T 12471]|uniref:GNAT family N-acetyltransferase n=1 Tax=Actinocorallia sp. A-T 12471 TaxID=3089813 RepID=UPI0029D372D8|nr:GNAT family N-acetyltransferase [Actinocorallia sp. A-T 12471]MDX6740384.1 GNAT family N-acetyltransferase [Actinocorallia sp. A-T 12471]
MGVEIVKVGPEAVDDLRELWLELHHHHQRVQPGWRYKDDEASWLARRAEYGGWLDGDGFALLAREGDKTVGYALVEVRTDPDDTWVSADRIAHIHSLLVRPEGRGHGVGTSLLDAVDTELAALGVKDVWIDALAANTDAITLYERRGFRPAVLYLARLTT